MGIDSEQIINAFAVGPDVIGPWILRFSGSHNIADRIIWAGIMMTSTTLKSIVKSHARFSILSVSLFSFTFFHYQPYIRWEIHIPDLRKIYFPFTKQGRFTLE